jgi:hypothetical protein
MNSRHHHPERWNPAAPVIIVIPDPTKPEPQKEPEPKKGHNKMFGRFNDKELADKCAADNNGYVKDFTYKKSKKKGYVVLKNK